MNSTSGSGVTHSRLVSRSRPWRSWRYGSGWTWSSTPGSSSGKVRRDDGPPLAAGPDVWEVASVLAQQEGTPEERVRAAAEHLGLSTRQVEAAAGYWASHKAEIDQRIAENAAAADRELAAWEERRALLGA